MSNSVRPQASLSFTISQSLLRLTSIESVMPPNHLDSSEDTIKEWHTSRTDMEEKSFSMQIEVLKMNMKKADSAIENQASSLTVTPQKRK